MKGWVLLLIPVFLLLQAGGSWAEQKVIVYSRIVDLSHAITTDMPIWPGDPTPTIEPVATVEEEGYFLNKLCIGEHSGTHVGAPAHFHSGGATIDQVPVELLVLPAVVIDIRGKAEEDPDYRLTVEDILSWEKEHGRIPEGSMVILFTGWQSRWNDPKAFFNADEQGTFHWPGFSAEATRFLVEERKVAGLGTDTHGIDPGNDETFAPNTILLGAGGIHLENLTNLDQLPPTGAVLVIGALKIKGGSGSPARVLAFVP